MNINLAKIFYYYRFIKRYFVVLERKYSGIFVENILYIK